MSSGIFKFVADTVMAFTQNEKLVQIPECLILQGAGVGHGRMLVRLNDRTPYARQLTQLSAYYRRPASVKLFRLLKGILRWSRATQCLLGLCPF